ncbi:helix-turn-helix domain-containing protein [Brevundimonas sp. LPMIX5]|uniref:helix-turn-helix domain-containing protein n=1 Tax=Brevundimonas sp. LPMIX5 TaxID=2305887 RepID=UPI0013146B85|nr:helix-turn-helix transcriptional regulator [Brevundimonas sp. LPMIX5]
MTQTEICEKSTLAKALKDRVGISTSYAHEIAHGQRTPSLRLAVKIEQVLGIAPARWVSPANDTSPASEAA